MIKLINDLKYAMFLHIYSLVVCSAFYYWKKAKFSRMLVPFYNIIRKKQKTFSQKNTITTNRYSSTAHELKHS